MNRRHFLAAGAAALLTGCPQRPPRPDAATVGPAADPATLARIREQRAARVAHVAALAKRPPTPGPFVTLPPGLDLLALAPELKGVAKAAHRLHPRYAAEPGQGSHLGGATWLWPAGEPWPVAPNGDLLVPALQLLQADAPGQFAFKPGSDLLQLFWQPRFTDKLPRTKLAPFVAWHRRADPKLTATPHPLGGVGVGAPGTPDAEFDALGVWTDYAPAPCVLTPEKVLEFPSWDVLPERMRAKLREVVPGGEAEYRANLCTAAGTKVGGYAPHQPDPLAALPGPRKEAPQPPACPTCRWGMDYLLTVAEREWPDEAGTRWKPAGDGGQRDAGLTLGPSGDVHLFACRRCEAWPCAATG